MNEFSDKFFTIGQIGKTFGFKGEFRVNLLTDFPERFNTLKECYISPDFEKIEPIKKIVKEVKNFNGKVILSFEGIDSKEKVKEIVNYYICLLIEDLTKLPEDEIYKFELVGMKVEDKSKGYMGDVSEYYDFSGNPCIEIEKDLKKELYPYHKDFIKEIDREQKIIFTDYSSIL